MDFEFPCKSALPFLWFVEYLYTQIYKYMCVSNVIYSFLSKKNEGCRGRRRRLDRYWCVDDDHRERDDIYWFGYTSGNMKWERESGSERFKRNMIWWNIKGIESVDLSIARGILHVPICVCHPPGLLARFFLHSLYYYF